MSVHELSSAARDLLRTAYNPAMAAAYRYWSAKQRSQGGGMPGRQHIDPLEMAEFLPHVILFDIERSATGFRFRHRLTGTHFAQIFGRDVNGLYIEESGSLETFESVYQRLSAIVTDKLVVYGVAPCPVKDKDFVQYEHLTFPLATDGETVDMLFGVRCLLPPHAGPRENGYATMAVAA